MDILDISVYSEEILWCGIVGIEGGQRGSGGFYADTQLCYGHRSFFRIKMLPPLQLLHPKNFPIQNILLLSLNLLSLLFNSTGKFPAE